MLRGFEYCAFMGFLGSDKVLWVWAFYRPRLLQGLFNPVIILISLCWSVEWWSNGASRSGDGRGS